MCGFSWQLQLRPLQTPSAHMVRFQQGALTQPALGLAGAAVRGMLDSSVVLWQELSVGSSELVLSKAGLTCLLPLGLGVPHEVWKGIGDKTGARCYFSCPWQWC